MTKFSSRYTQVSKYPVLNPVKGGEAVGGTSLISKIIGRTPTGPRATSDLYHRKSPRAASVHRPGYGWPIEAGYPKRFMIFEPTATGRNNYPLPMNARSDR